MEFELTPSQRADRAAFRVFVDRVVAPEAGRYDREERIPGSVISELARAGHLGLTLPVAVGGQGKDILTYGLLNEELGRGCSSVRSLVTVHGMVSHALSRWGTSEQRERWLPLLARGAIVGAFALTEPLAGSDAQSIEARAEATGDGYRLNGVKRWISFGQIARLFLVFARVAGKPAAFLVERSAPGLTIDPMGGLLGARASMLAELRFDDCGVPADQLLGGVGCGITHIALSALDLGRYCVACGCVGIAQAALEAVLKYVNTRKQFGSYLKQHQLIRRMISNMVTNIRAARLLCYRAGCLKDAGDPRAIGETLIAKYFASKAAAQAASDAVQIHGANGCRDSYPVERYMRDARIMEIIEGSNEIQQLAIADFAEAEAGCGARGPHSRPPFP